MMKLTIILTLLATVLLVMEVKGYISPTRDFTFASNKAKTVAIDSDLYTVSYYDVKIMVNSSEQRQVYLNVTSSNIFYEPCKITLSPELAIQWVIQTAPVWRKIVVWGVQSRKYSGDDVLTNYTYLLVDPRTCTYQALPNITDSSRLGAPSEPKVVVHQDRLDIFYSSRTVCSPCTFDFNGDKIDVMNQLKHLDNPLKEFHVRTIGKSHNYVVLYELAVGSKGLILFDEYSYQKTVIDLDFRSTIKAVAANSVENHPYIGVISVSNQRPSRQPLYTVYDQYLSIVFKAYLPLLDDYNNDQVFANIDSAGNSYVTMIQREKRGPNWKITMVRYDASGRLVDEVVVGTKIHLGVEVGYVEEAVLIGEREYCFVVHTSRGFEHPTESTSVKCFDVSRRD